MDEWLEILKTVDAASLQDFAILCDQVEQKLVINPKFKDWLSRELGKGTIEYTSEGKFRIQNREKLTGWENWP